MLLGFLLVLLVLVCIALATVILLQRSEGGALGMGGGPSGFMTARGAGDLLTRITSALAVAFFLLCLLLTVLSGRAHQGGSVVDRLKVDAMSPDALNRSIRPAAPAPAAPAGTAPSVASQFEAPTPEVHTVPAGSPAAAPAAPPATTTDNAARTHTSDRAGVQAAPQSTPTVAPAAAPQAAPATSAAGNSQ
jgi:preprotein translocase subunit SecG